MTLFTGTILSVSLVGGALSLDHRAGVRLLVSQPICGGLLAGLVLGDWRGGFFAGAILQMMFLGAIPVRGAPLPDLPLGGVIASALYILAPRATDGAADAKGLVLACSLAAGIAAAVAGRSAVRFWERRADAFVEAARRHVEKGRWWAASAIHFSTLILHFAFGFVAAGAATASLVPLVAAAAGTAAGSWCEPLRSLDVLLPFIGAGALLAANVARTRIFWFFAGFACVVLVLLFRG
jgi:mannose/fructose/N-acetylgalactosamine-specific phosphotransferase system component IIC